MGDQARTRYPGAQPFMDDDLSRRLFFGRTQEISALTNQILVNRLVVLFALSGLGKTSLLNAGVAERLREEGFLPLTVRLNDLEIGPVESLYRGIETACDRLAIEYVAGDRTSLWHFFKTAEFWQDDVLLKPVLILDQFEELFTLQTEEERTVFIDQLSTLVRGVRPTELLSNEAGAQVLVASRGNSPPVVKVLVSLREDFLAHLEELSDRIPEILDQRFRLLPLTRSAAAMAMEMPTAIEDSCLATQPFEIDARAKEDILDFLERRAISTIKISRKQQIEPFQLQLICQHLEEIAKNEQRKARDRVRVTLEKIGGKARLNRLFKGFYKRQVDAIPSFRQRRGVRKLCSEYLINVQGRRLKLEESEINRLVGVKPDTLKRLVDRRLLRVDQGIDGNYYELSHDSLITPVLDSMRLLFWFRLLGLLALLVVISLIVTSWFAGAINLMIEFLEDEPFLASATGVFVLGGGWLFCRWFRRKFRTAREMWRRARL